jgi:hypothetical protein
MHVRIDEHKPTSLFVKRLGSGWSGPRIVKTSEKLYFIIICEKNIKVVYKFGLDGLLTTNREFGISGSWHRPKNTKRPRGVSKGNARNSNR